MAELNWDPMGKVIIEIRSDAEVAAIVGANPTSTPPRVRGGEPMPSDIQPRESWRAFVKLVNLGGPRWRRVPVQRPRLAAQCYGRTFAEAAHLATAVSNAIHFVGPREHANGLGIYASFDDTSGEQDKDPDTQQPFVTVFIDLIGTTQAVA